MESDRETESLTLTDCCLDYTNVDTDRDGRLALGETGAAKASRREAGKKNALYYHGDTISIDSPLQMGSSETPDSDGYSIQLSGGGAGVDLNSEGLETCYCGGDCDHVRGKKNGAKRDEGDKIMRSNVELDPRCTHKFDFHSPRAGQIQSGSESTAFMSSTKRKLKGVKIIQYSPSTPQLLPKTTNNTSRRLSELNLASQSSHHIAQTNGQDRRGLKLLSSSCRQPNEAILRHLRVELVCESGSECLIKRNITQYNRGFPRSFAFRTSLVGKALGAQARATQEAAREAIGGKFRNLFNILRKNSHYDDNFKDLSNFEQNRELSKSNESSQDTSNNIDSAGINATDGNGNPRKVNENNIETEFNPNYECEISNTSKHESCQDTFHKTPARGHAAAEPMIGNERRLDKIENDTITRRSDDILERREEGRLSSNIATSQLTGDQTKLASLSRQVPGFQCDKSEGTFMRNQQRMQATASNNSTRHKHEAPPGLIEGGCNLDTDQEYLRDSNNFIKVHVSDDPNMKISKHSQKQSHRTVSEDSSSDDRCSVTIERHSHPPMEGLKERDVWGKNIEFLLAVIGFAVDLGNVWRFPYVCYKNGGGAFLIPYTIMFVLGGLPIFYLEMSLGQYFSSGCLTVWKRVCPMLKGIGYAMCVLNFFTGLYYNTIISWAVFFFVESFTLELPWTTCDNPWNSKDCKTIDQRRALDLNEGNLSYHVYFSTPTKDYFEREVLQRNLSTGISDLGSIRKPLAIYLAIVFVCIYFAIWKGVKSTGKAVWITALLPYFVLLPLLIRGVFLEGAWQGIRYYLYPQWGRVVDVNVWVEAAIQIYFSLGPGFGTLMALSSYNKFHHNSCKDALIAATVNYLASFISGFVIFAVLGYMAAMEGVSVNDVAREGPGLVFQVYPEGLATMQFSSIWSILFFIMVITLGIDSTFGGLESVITGLCDEYPRVLRAHRGIFIGILIIVIYLCSLPTTTYGGNYVIYLLESYGTSLSLLFIVLIETITVCWIYGVDRFCQNLSEMNGHQPAAYWRICWKFISPTILLLIFFAACLQELDKYNTLTDGDYTYPGWAPRVGLLMTGASVMCIPIYAIYYIKFHTTGPFSQRLKIAIRPLEQACETEKEKEDTRADKIGKNDSYRDTSL